MRTSVRAVSLLFLLSAGACRDGGDSKTPLSAVVPNGSASVPAFARTSAPAPEETAAEDSAPAPAADQTDQEAAEPEGDGAAGEEDAAEPEKAEAPLPDVEVKNVGMHIGGEANTAEQKRPIRAAVAAHYDEMKRCYAKAEDPPKGATFGVDMRIKGEGGTAKISNPRSGLKGGGVKECLVSVFEAIEFPKQPKNAPRMVSFSIEFRKK